MAVVHLLEALLQNRLLLLRTHLSKALRPEASARHEVLCCVGLEFLQRDTPVMAGIGIIKVSAHLSVRERHAENGNGKCRDHEPPRSTARLGGHHHLRLCGRQS